MSNRPHHLLLEDMWESVEKIGRYVAGLSEDAFLSDERTVDAVVRNLEIVGEAASRLPGDIRSLTAEVEWRKIIGLRHRIVHHYFGVDTKMVWQILMNDLPAFREALERMRRELSSTGLGPVET